MISVYNKTKNLKAILQQKLKSSSISATFSVYTHTESAQCILTVEQAGEDLLTARSFIWFCPTVYSQNPTCEQSDNISGETEDEIILKRMT